MPNFADVTLLDRHGLTWIFDYDTDLWEPEDDTLDLGAMSQDDLDYHHGPLFADQDQLDHWLNEDPLGPGFPADDPPSYTPFEQALLDELRRIRELLEPSTVTVQSFGNTTVRSYDQAAEAMERLQARAMRAATEAGRG